ncbi:restriction endonuclease subunit S [Lactobacillus delbrueckii subsp. bulgaricus]|nr:restriction endonuclease subunit S [Lactobacillus delbrueckii subsp. bulgaricus]
MPGHAGTGGRDVIFAWEQCKLGDVCEEVSGNNGNVKGLPILTISAANGWMNQKDRFSQVIAGNELKKYTLLKKGHLAYNHGNSKQAKYGTVFVQNLYDQALVPRVYHSFKMKTENNPYYVEYYFATKKLDRELARLVTSGARMDGLLNINKKDFFKIKFEVPTPVEQSLIGTILQKLDQTITLHEEKKRQLECLKSALLQKMFADKSGYPAVRFKGFDERWERHVLNDLAIFNPKCTLPTSFEYVDLGSVIGVEMISHKTISKFDAPSRAQRLAQVGDLFYQTVRPYQQNNYLFDNKDNAYVFSTGYAQLRPLIDGYFLLCLVQTKSFVRKVMNACTGTSYPAINSQDLAQIRVNIPINSKEQRLIGNLYKVIDNLVTLYQRKLDDLNTIKQSLLQKMFI